MMTTSHGTKLDLSRLTDEEAKHVWHVVQRDFDLRKAEEDRLGDLKSKIVKEDTKRELLGHQSNLSDSLCIHCLQPFKFLLNTKRQCLDCKLFVCKACSHFNKKEHGWVCDPCQMNRVLKIGTVEWFHENVRARFKRFGSAKVMKSLFKRLKIEQTWLQTDLRESPDYADSMPDVQIDSLSIQDDEHAEGLEREHYKLTSKGKRLLPVDPQDFNLGNDHSIHFHHSPKNEKSVPEEDWASVFRVILENARAGRGEGKKNIHHSSRGSLDMPSLFDNYTSPGNKIERSHSLSKISYSSACSANYHAYHEVPPSIEDSEEELVDDSSNLMYAVPLQREYSPDGVPPQITELNRRMSAIETLLGRLEQKMTFANQPVCELDKVKPEEELLSPVDQVEQELKKKLEELTENISDKGLSSDEDEANDMADDINSLGRSEHYCATVMGRNTASIDKNSLFCKVQKSSVDTERPFNTQRNRNSYDASATSNCALSQLETRVALTAASVQSTQSGVTEIENRIAVMNPTGKTAVMNPTENHWKKCVQTMVQSIANDTTFGV